MSQFDFEKDLRNDRASFDRVRKLSPTRFRFRFKNSQGVDVWELSHWSINSIESTNAVDTVDSNTFADCNAGRQANPTLSPEFSDFSKSYQSVHFTSVKCKEPAPGEYTLARASTA